MIEFAEEELYEPIGRWLKTNKGCQRFLTRTNIKGHQADVVALRYDIDWWKTRDELRFKPVFLFHGFIVEVKKNPDSQSLFNLRGEVDDIIRKLKNEYHGMHSYRIYMAYPTDVVDKDTLSFAEEHGVGILRLDIFEKNPQNLFTDEVLEAQAKTSGSPIPNAGMQTGAWVFEQAVKETGWLYKMLQRPTKVWEDLLGPAHREYDEKKFRVAGIKKQLRPKSVEINCVNPYLAKNMSDRFVRIFGERSTPVKVIKTSTIDEKMGSIFIDTSTSESAGIKPGDMTKLSDRLDIYPSPEKIYLRSHADHTYVKYMERLDVDELKRQLLGAPIERNDVLDLHITGTEITLEVIRTERYRKSVTNSILISDQTEIVKAAVVNGSIREII